MRVRTVDMFGVTPGRGSALDVLVPDRRCDRDLVEQAAAHARRTSTDESALVSERSRARRTFASRIFNAGGETPFGTHSLAGVAACLVSEGHLAPGEVGRTARAGCQWLWTDGGEVRVPFDGPVVDQEVPREPEVFGPYPGAPHASGVGRGFTLVRDDEDPGALPAPDLDRMRRRGLTDLTLYRWDPERRQVLARVFAPGFGIPEDSGCLPVAAALGVAALRLAPDLQDEPLTVRQVTERGTESVFTCAGSVRDGIASVRVGGRVWVDRTDDDQEGE